MSIDANYIKILKNSKFEVLTPDGFKNFSGLGKSINKNFLTIITEISEITVTTKHQFFKKIEEDYFIPFYADELCINDEIMANKVITKIKKIIIEKYTKPCFDLINVETTNSYFTNCLLSKNCLVLDEFAHVPNNIADEFMASVYPTITASKTSKMIVLSTPKGMNSFYHIYRGAVRGENSFKPININWWEVPGRDENYKKRIIRDFGIIQWNQEYAAKFLGSSTTLIDSDLLEKWGTESWEPIDDRLGGSFLIYEQPVKNAVYILGVDTAKGVGSDSSVIQVLRYHDEFDIREVAIYANNTINPHTFATQVVRSISNYYNDAYCMIENNDVGGQVVDALFYECEFDRIIDCDPNGMGIRSNKKTKLDACLLMKRYAEEGWLKVYDRETIKEFTYFEEVSLNIFQAESGKHDDRVTSLMWALYYVKTPYFDRKNMAVPNIKTEFALEEQEHEDAPIILINNGIPEVDKNGLSWDEI